MALGTGQRWRRPKQRPRLIICGCQVLFVCVCRLPNVHVRVCMGPCVCARVCMGPCVCAASRTFGLRPVPLPTLLHLAGGYVCVVAYIRNARVAS